MLVHRFQFALWFVLYRYYSIIYVPTFYSIGKVSLSLLLTSAYCSKLPHIRLSLPYYSKFPFRQPSKISYKYVSALPVIFRSVLILMKFYHHSLHHIHFHCSVPVMMKTWHLFLIILWSLNPAPDWDIQTCAPYLQIYVMYLPRWVRVFHKFDHLWEVFVHIILKVSDSDAMYWIFDIIVSFVHSIIILLFFNAGHKSMPYTFAKRKHNFLYVLW